MRSFFVRFTNTNVPGSVLIRVKVKASSVEQAIPAAKEVLYGLVQDDGYFVVDSVDPS